MYTEDDEDTKNGLSRPIIQEHVLLVRSLLEVSFCLSRSAALQPLPLQTEYAYIYTLK